MTLWCSLNAIKATQWHLWMNSCPLGSFGSSVYFLRLLITWTCEVRRFRQWGLIYVQGPCWFSRTRGGVQIFGVIWGTSCSRKATHLGPSSLAEITEFNVFLSGASDSGGVFITGAEWFQSSSTILGRKPAYKSHKQNSVYHWFMTTEWQINKFKCKKHQHIKVFLS